MMITKRSAWTGRENTREIEISQEQLDETQRQLEEAMELLSELRDGTGMSSEQKERYDRMVNDEAEPTVLDRIEEMIGEHESELGWSLIQDFTGIKAIVEQIANSPLWTEAENGMEGGGISRDFQEDRENEAQDWIRELRLILNIDPGYKDLSK